MQFGIMTVWAFYIIPFLIKFDKNNIFHFAAMQTKSGENIMQEYRVLNDRKSIILIKEEVVLYKSDAIIEIARQIQVQNENLRNAIAFLKNITHSGVISDQKNNGDIIGISNELKSEISSMIDKLDKCNISGYDCNQIIEKYINK
jgi:hypothetical protein